MSATPPTPRGRETERLMLLWRKQNPDAEASAYNREWDGVYMKLEGTFSDDEAPQRGFLGELQSDDSRWIHDTTDPHPAAMVADRLPKRRREKRICKANYPATKGAFGKPKHLRRR